MRKRTFLSIFDNVIWCLLGLLPIIYALFTCVLAIDSGAVIQDFNTTINTFFNGVSFDSNAIYIVLNGIFNSSYNLSINDTFLKCIAFFGTAQLVHFVLDVTLLLFNIVHKFMDRLAR